MIYQFLYYFLLFIIYSSLGWLMETCLCSIEQKKLVNRGFLIGPYCPIYGVGALIIILTLSDYKNNLFVLFGMALLICSFLEYFTSWLMEKLFNARWWDYSKEKMNLEGRICLKNSLLFGLGGLLVVMFIQPIMTNLLKNIEPSILSFISILSMVLLFIDLVCSSVIIKKMRLILSKTRSDLSDEIGKRVKEIIFNQSIFSRRLLIAYPDIKIPNIKIRKLRKKDRHKQ